MRLLFCAVVLAVLAGFPAAGAATPAPAQPLHGAGLVIQHGDGRVLYFYVQFSEPEITGTELLERSGVSLDITPYAALGAGVCRIDGEGCPSSNCFCKSYANPSFFWRYHQLGADGAWKFVPYGPNQRKIHDGDVDGWSWSSEDGDLPPTPIEQIAMLNGVARATPVSPATPDATTTPISSPAMTATPFATEVPATATPSVLGVEVSDNGTATPIEPVSHAASRSWRGYAPFGIGILTLLLIASISIVRRQRGRTR